MEKKQAAEERNLEILDEVGQLQDELRAVKEDNTRMVFSLKEELLS